MTLSSLARGSLSKGASASIAPLCRQRLSGPSALVALSAPSNRRAQRHFSSSPRVALRASSPTQGLFGGWGRSTQPPLSPVTSESTAAREPHATPESAAQSSTEPQSSAGAPETAVAQPSSSIDQTASQGSDLASSASESHLSTVDAALSGLDPSAVPAAIAKTFDQIDHSWWPNVRLAEWALNSAHELTGMPWWAVMVSVTLAARVVLLPLHVKATATGIRANNVKPEVEEATAAVKAATANKDDLARSAAINNLQRIWTKHGTHPTTMFRLPLIQGTFFMTLFFAAKRLGENGLVGLQEGVLWLPSLCTGDSTYFLPTLSAASALVVFETGAEMGAAAGQAMNPNMKWFFRAMLPVGAWLSAYFPAAVFFFWIPNNLFSLAQVLLLQNPKVQQRLGMPKRINWNEGKAPVPKKSGPGGIAGFIENIKAGYNAERDNQRLHNRSQAYQKWLKPDQTQDLSQPATPAAPAAPAAAPPTQSNSRRGPRSDLFEAAEIAEQSTSQAPAAPVRQESPAETAKKAKLRALTEKRTKQQRV